MRARLRISWLAAACTLVCAASAQGADRVYWSNDAGSPVNQHVSFTSLDGSASGDLMTAPATMNGPLGTALDPAAGRVYWANTHGEISYANLDGSGGGADLPTGAASVMNPNGLVLDHTGGRVYWADYDGQKIAYANLDGSGGGNIDTTGATVSAPTGVAVDPGSGRIYWTNSGAAKIGYANLDGSGGNDLNTTGATVSNSYGIALDTAAGRAYWVNNAGAGSTISYARLDNSGGEDITVTGVPVNGPVGIALDPGAQRLYWGDTTKLRAANLDGSGGANVDTGAGSAIDIKAPALLAKPNGAGAPAVSGAGRTGSILTCSNGSWDGDLVSAALYRAPQSLSFQWARDGADIGGASANTYVPTVPGSYACRVIASNAAGSTSQASAAHAIVYAFGPRTFVTLRLAPGRLRPRGPLKVRAANANPFGVTGRLSGRTAQRVEASRKRRVALRGKSFRLPAKGVKTIRLALPKPVRRALKRSGRLRLRLTAQVRDPAGVKRTVRKRVTPKLKRR